MEITVNAKAVKELGASRAIIYYYFKANPGLKIDAIANDLGMVRRTISRVLVELAEAGYLKHVGTGKYIFLK